MTSLSMHDSTIPTHFVPGLVALSVFVAALAGYIALDLIQRSATAGRNARRILIGVGGVTMGLAVVIAGGAADRRRARPRHRPLAGGRDRP